MELYDDQGNNIGLHPKASVVFDKKNNTVSFFTDKNDRLLFGKNGDNKLLFLGLDPTATMLLIHHLTGLYFQLEEETPQFNRFRLLESPWTVSPNGQGN